MIKEILKLGNPALYEVCAPVTGEDPVKEWVVDLHDTLIDYRNTYGAGRAIAVPQIGFAKRLIYMYTDRPYVFINPVLTFPDDEKYVLKDDCMSFPGLCVLVERYKRAVIKYQDINFEPQELALEGDFSELLQHEYDHLEGILSTMRAVDNKAFFMEIMKRDE